MKHTTTTTYFPVDYPEAIRQWTPAVDLLATPPTLAALAMLQQYRPDRATAVDVMLAILAVIGRRPTVRSIALDGLAGR